MQPLKTAGAWQPLTPRGVARFALAPLKQLLLVQFVFAAVIAATVVWFLHAAWFPTIGEAIRRLPARGEIRLGFLEWPENQPQLLAEGRFLALVVDPAHTGQVRSPAHVQAEFGRKEVRFISLLGYSQWRYPGSDGVLAFNRTELEPWWGAWGPPILGLVFVVVVMGLMILWALLAVVCLWPAWLAGFFLNRDLPLWPAWKLSAAAWLPGTLILVTAILFHGFGFLDLVQLLAAAVLHLVAGGIYVLAAPVYAPKLASATKRKGNPFAGKAE